MFLSVCMGAVLTFLDGSSRTPHAAPLHPNPVLLIHGLADSETHMGWLARYLRQEGWEVHTMSLRPNWGQSGLEDLARQLDHYVHHQFGARRFDLVGFSMGGLVCRYYVQRMGGLQQVEHFVTLSTPHHGTVAAHLIPNRGCREMRPGSEFLRDLARDADQLKRLKFTSLYTPYDLVIIPHNSSCMPQATNVELPVAAHVLMPLDARCLRRIAEALRS